MPFIEEDEQYDGLVDALSEAIKGSGEKTKFTKKESEIIRESRDRTLSEDIAQGLLDVFDKLVGTAGDIVDTAASAIGIETEETELEKQSEKRLKESKKRKQLLEESQVGGVAGSISESLVEPLIEATALWRLGIVGEGTASIPATGATWGASEYAIRRGLGDTHEQAMDSALVVGSIGKAVSMIPLAGKASAKVYDDVQETAFKEAGGGPPPKADEFDETPMQKAEEDYKYFSEDEVTNLTGKNAEQRAIEAEMRQEGLEEIDSRTPRSEIKTTLDKEIEEIQNKFKKIEEDVEGYIIENNKELFEGVDKLDAYQMLKTNKKLTEELRNELEVELFDRMEKIDFIKRGDDRIVEGAKSELYEAKDIDTTKAEQLAMDVKIKRIAAQKIAEDTTSKMEGKKLNYEKVITEIMPEVNKLYKVYKANPTPETLFDLEESIRKVEPVKTGKGETRGTLDTLDGFVEVGDTLSVSDIAAKDAAVGIGVKDTLKKGSAGWKAREEKIVKQREKNKIAHEEFLEENSDKIKIGKAKELIEKPIERNTNNKVIKEKREQFVLESGEVVEGRIINENPELAVVEYIDKKSSKKTEKVFDKNTRTEVPLGESRGKQSDIVNEADRIEYEKLVEQDRKYRDADKKFEAQQKELGAEPRDDVTSSEKLVDFVKEQIRETKANFNSGFKTTGVYKEYQRLHQATRDALNEAARAGKQTAKNITESFKENGVEIGGKFDKDFTTNVLYTDYIAIREMNRVDAANFMRQYKDVYSKSGKYIEATAKGIADKGYMNNVNFSNNGYQAAQRAGLNPDEFGNIIDKMISIRAVQNNKAWSFIESNIDNPLFNKLVDMADAMSKQSDDLFRNNMHQRLKGYTSEIYDSIYRYEMKDGEFKELIDAEVGMVQGGLPQKLDTSRIGDVENFPKGVKNLSDSAKLKYAEANNLGVILNKYGQPVATRKVASEAQRLSIGKSQNASDVLPLTFENNVRKIQQRDGVIEDILNTKDNELFSSTKRKGLVKLSKDELRTIPVSIRDKFKYVNPDFKHMLLGNKQIQIAEKQWTKILEQLLKDTVSHFKENVVLKNPASWANNMGYNFFVNLQEGIGVKTTLNHMRKGLKEKQLSETLANKLIDLQLAGKVDSQEYLSIKKELENNLYYKMDRKGLAVTVMSNIMDSPIASKRLSDKMMKEITIKVFGKKLGGNVSEIVSNIYISPQSSIGQRAMNLFGSIDAMGRYSLAYEKMLKGASIEDAIKKANGIYGDLDMITPMWSQAIQHYGFIPFSNWYFRMSGGLAKSVLDNKMKAIGVAALLYGISEVTDTRTASMNPLDTLIDTPFEMMEMSPYFNFENYTRNTTTPAVYKKGYRAIEREDPLSVVFTKDF